MTRKEIFLILLLAAVILGWSYLICAFGVWLLSLAFGFSFTWFKAFVVWIVLNLFFGGVKTYSNRSQ